MKLIPIISLFLFMFSGAVVQTAPEELQGSYAYFSLPPGKELQVGEDITYLVRYMFIKLGEIRLKVLDKFVKEGRIYYKTIAYIDSYNVPFVNLHQIYESVLNESFYSEYFKGTVKHPEYTTFTEYNFQYAGKKVGVRKGKVSPYELWTDSTGTAETFFHDGLSIFYYARLYTGQSKSENVPCLVNEKKVYTKINFQNKIEEISIDAVDYDIPCYYLDGRTDFVSVFGLTGYFEGWFSQDNHSIPIMAKLNVIIGKVTVELIKWNKKGWAPPRAS